MLNRVDLAIEVATKAHKNQMRKTTDTPYISHPFSVGMILSRVGCTEDVIVAGILHDTVEDTDITLEYIRENFGEKVAAIVEGCSEPDKSLSWEERKEHTLEYLRTAPLEVLLVACADKLHNIRSISSEYCKIGDNVWERFKRGREKQEWYYRGLVESLCCGMEDSIFQEFKEQVESVFAALK